MELVRPRVAVTLVAETRLASFEMSFELPG